MTRVPAFSARGALLILLAGVGISFGGLIVRHITVATTGRSSSTVPLRRLGTVAADPLRDRTALVATFRRVGWPGLYAGLAISVAMVTFILSVNATSVANTLFLLAVSPFMAAVLGWLLLRERVDRSTWTAMAVALVGVAIMVWHGLTGAAYTAILWGW